ncbi:FUSC family protein [Roseibium sp. RKSG952]|uniref:FUSC family protein n=1 Tax=Roseibium sp. RKSG952 TaxID=2529384 RepID=UPI0012BC5475|nr:FUSC family protein [Roseibium sp. RKSG952]MTH97040.1 hypothetical protein [Roseibium sp. RKSG952]
MSRVENWQPKAIVTGIACVASVFVAEALHMPSNFLAPYVAFVSVNLGARDLRLILTANLFFMIAGFVLGAFAAEILLGRPVWQFLFIVVFSYLATLVRFGPINQFLAFASFLFFWFAAYIVLISVYEPTSLYVIYWDFNFSVVIGVVCAWVAARLAIALGFKEPVRDSPAPLVEDREKELHDAELIALVGATAIAVALLLWVWFDLPAITQIALTIALTVDRDIAVGFARRRQRLIGCFFGGGVALLVIVLNPESYLLWLIVFFLVTYVSSAWQINEPERDYAGLQAATAFFLVLSGTEGERGDIIGGVDRLAGIYIGILLLMILRYPFINIVFRLYYAAKSGAKSKPQ